MTDTPENRRILVVDDEAEIRQGYRSFLMPPRTERLPSSRATETTEAAEAVSAFSYEVAEAASGEEALALFERELKAGRRFAGAIVDVSMPGSIDGLQFIQKAWELDPELLVVVATAYQDRSVDEIHRLFGGRFADQWDYLNKPFTAGEIKQKARQLVSSWNRRAREHAYLAQIESQGKALIAQEQLAAVGKLARSVGHDLGNILQNVLTKLELAQADSELIKAVELGANVCQDLLMFSRRAKEHTPLEKVRLSEPLAKALRLLRQELRKKDIRVEREIDEALSWVGHESRFSQVFVNLMTNAIQAMEAGGCLTVSCRARPGGGGEVVIRDTGSGISAENLKHVFEPLFTTKGERGNGLGLTVCKNIVERYGGTIAIDSRAGEGTAVCIAFS